MTEQGREQARGMRLDCLASIIKNNYPEHFNIELQNESKGRMTFSYTGDAGDYDQCVEQIKETCKSTLESRNIPPLELHSYRSSTVNEQIIGQFYFTEE